MGAPHRYIHRRGIGIGLKNNKHLVDEATTILDPVLGLGSTTTTAANPPAQTTPANETRTPVPGPQPGTGTGNGATSPADPANTPSTESGSGSGNTTPGVVVVGGTTITTATGTATGTAPSVATATASKGTSTGVTGTDAAHGSTTSSTEGNVIPDTGSVKDSKNGPTYSSSGSGTLGSDPNPSSIDTQALGDGKGGGINGGAVAGVVIVILLVIIGVVVLLLRRRVRARRDEQAIKWWFTRNRTSQATYGDTEAIIPRSASRRSSFATTFDHSNVAFASSAIPPPPPMAEFGRPKGTAPTLVLDVNADQNRFSIGSAGSHNSQFLVVHHRESLQPEVMPSKTACSESFSFPKPPVGDRSSMHTRGSDRSRNNSPVKQSPPTSTIKFDDDLIYLASPIMAPRQNPLSPTAIHVQSAPVTVDPFTDNNPFDDPAHTHQFSEIELVRRPFFPQLQDELQVNVGESVRIVQIFDDGWALVEKIFAVSKPNVEGEQGLIPLDCMRDVIETASPIAGRLSSQGGKKRI